MRPPAPLRDPTAAPTATATARATAMRPAPAARSVASSVRPSLRRRGSSAARAAIPCGSRARSAAPSALPRRSSAASAAPISSSAFATAWPATRRTSNGPGRLCDQGCFDEAVALVDPIAKATHPRFSEQASRAARTMNQCLAEREAWESRAEIARKGGRRQPGSPRFRDHGRTAGVDSGVDPQRAGRQAPRRHPNPDGGGQDPARPRSTAPRA